MTFLEVLFLLHVGHAVCDYGLQTRYMALNRHKFSILFPHCLMHGGAVFLVTNSLGLAVSETISHYLLDKAKEDTHATEETDQFMHYAFKVCWAIIYTFSPALNGGS